MAFVNEFVPEEQKDKFDPEVFNLGLARPPSRPYRWVIDRERDIFLIHVRGSGSGGGQGDGYIPPHHYSLSYEGLIVKFEAEVRSHEKTKNCLVRNWVVKNLTLPPELKDKKNQVIELLKEAIAVHGDSSGTPDADIVEVNILFN
jgi:hypothetical protein